MCIWPLSTHCAKFTVTDAPPVQIDRLPVFFKQRDALFFPTWAYVVPTNLGRIPVSFLETTIWVGECMLQINVPLCSGRAGLEY